MTIHAESYQTFMGRLHADAERLERPLRAMFELTYRCNFACIHCYNSDAQKTTHPSKEVSTAEAFRIIDSLKEFGCWVLGFTGGEVFVRPDAMDIFRYAKQRGFQVMIYTNGYYIDERRADELHALAPNKVDISLHGLSDRAFGTITCRPDARQRVLRAIQLLADRRVPLGLKANAFAINKDELVDIRRLADSVNAQFRLSTEFFARNDGSPTPYQFQLPPDVARDIAEAVYPPQPIVAGVELQRAAPSEASPDVSDLQDLEDDVFRLPAPASGSRQAPGPESRQGVPRPARMFTCGVGRNSLVITPFGEVKPCLEFGEPAFPLAQYSLEECWRLLMNFADKANLTDDYECKTCELNAFCDSCPASRYLATGSMTACDPHARERAEYTKQLLNQRSRTPSLTGAASGAGCGSCSKCS